MDLSSFYPFANEMFPFSVAVSNSDVPFMQCEESEENVSKPCGLVTRFNEQNIVPYKKWTCLCTVHLIKLSCANTVTRKAKTAAAANNTAKKVNHGVIYMFIYHTYIKRECMTNILGKICFSP